MNEVEYPVSLLVGAYGKVYALSGEDNKVFYIGCTTRPLKDRLYQHIRDAKSTTSKQPVNKHKVEEIRKLNFKVYITLLETKWVTAPSKSLFASRLGATEREWILKYFRMGHMLTNTFITKFYIKQKTKQTA